MHPLLRAFFQSFLADVHQNDLREKIEKAYFEEILAHHVPVWFRNRQMAENFRPVPFSVTEKSDLGAFWAICWVKLFNLGLLFPTEGKGVWTL